MVHGTISSFYTDLDSPNAETISNARMFCQRFGRLYVHVCFSVDFGRTKRNREFEQTINSKQFTLGQSTLSTVDHWNFMLLPFIVMINLWVEFRSASSMWNFGLQHTKITFPLLRLCLYQYRAEKHWTTTKQNLEYKVKKKTCSILTYPKIWNILKRSNGEKRNKIRD